MVVVVTTSPVVVVVGSGVCLTITAPLNTTTLSEIESPSVEEMNLPVYVTGYSPSSVPSGILYVISITTAPSAAATPSPVLFANANS